VEPKASDVSLTLHRVSGSRWSHTLISSWDSVRRGVMLVVFTQITFLVWVGHQLGVRSTLSSTIFVNLKPLDLVLC
jgi:hypothetical protein